MIKSVGSDWDPNGCIASAGYVWCEILGKCIRTWIQACEYPQNCLTWNDGCNLCGLENGELTFCSEMACFTQGTPQCQVWSPETISTMPVINPFLGDGH